MNPWFPITLQKEHQKHRTFNIVTPNSNPNQIKNIYNTSQFIEQQILFRTNINKNTCKMVCKMQCLKNGL